jgi:hypothetical protein
MKFNCWNLCVFIICFQFVKKKVEYHSKWRWMGAEYSHDSYTKLCTPVDTFMSFEETLEEHSKIFFLKEMRQLE